MDSGGAAIMNNFDANINQVWENFEKFEHL